MSLLETTLEGVLDDEGTIRFDHKPDLPPGRVTCVVKAVPTEPATNTSANGLNWFEYLQKLRSDLEEAGSKFMNDQEVQAHIEWLREGDWLDERMKDMDRAESLDPEKPS